MRRGFTLLELLVTVVIIGILVTLALPLLAKLRARAERTQCTANLKSLHVGAQLFMQEKQYWPQIRLSAQTSNGLEDFAKSWIAELAPYGPSPKTWICPTLQNAAGKPDYTKPGNERLDYVPTRFDDKPTTPFDLGTPDTAKKTVPVPWFSERYNAHGNGNLIIFADGSVTDLKTITGSAGSPSN